MLGGSGTVSRTPAQARCCSHTSSARSSTYGSQPICPSLYASRRFGNCTSFPLKSQSVSDAIALPKVRVSATAGGASGPVAGIFDDDPTCMLTTVPVSSHARKNGSHSPEWIEGSPRLGGISQNVTARTPRSALRRISSAASSASQSGTMINGTRRPPESPHHSSTIQSLYARTQARASSRSFASRNVWPQKRGKVGKHSEASTQLTSMSSSRALGS